MAISIKHPRGGKYVHSFPFQLKKADRQFLIIALLCVHSKVKHGERKDRKPGWTNTAEEQEGGETMREQKRRWLAEGKFVLPLTADTASSSKQGVDFSVWFCFVAQSGKEFWCTVFMTAPAVALLICSTAPVLYKSLPWKTAWMEMQINTRNLLGCQSTTTRGNLGDVQTEKDMQVCERMEKRRKHLFGISQCLCKSLQNTQSLHLQLIWDRRCHVTRRIVLKLTWLELTLYKHEVNKHEAQPYVFILLKKKRSGLSDLIARVDSPEKSERINCVLMRNFTNGKFSSGLTKPQQQQQQKFWFTLADLLSIVIRRPRFEVST